MMKVLHSRRWMAILYFTVLAVELVGEALYDLRGWTGLIFAVKPLMMPILAVGLFTMSRPGRPDGFQKWMLSALFFSWLGDLFLMVNWTGIDLFLYGLAAFLIAHLCYIAAFLRGGSLKNIRWFAGLPILLWGGGLIGAFYCVGQTGFLEMQLPVILYTCVIIVMVLSAQHRKGRVSDLSYRLVFLGALLFMFSDSLIAIHKFTPLFEGHSLPVRLAIMATYGLAQYFIVDGSIRRAVHQPAG